MLSSILNESIKANNHPDINFSPTKMIPNQKFPHCHNKQGIGYPTALSQANLTWKSSLACSVSWSRNATSKSTTSNYDLSLFLLEHIPNKEMLLLSPFGHTYSPYGIGQVIHLLGKGFYQPQSLQGMLQYQGTVDLQISIEISP